MTQGLGIGHVEGVECCTEKARQEAQVKAFAVIERARLLPTFHGKGSPKSAVIHRDQAGGDVHAHLFLVGVPFLALSLDLCVALHISPSLPMHAHSHLLYHPFHLQSQQKPSRKREIEAGAVEPSGNVQQSQSKRGRTIRHAQPFDNSV